MKIYSFFATEMFRTMVQFLKKMTTKMMMMSTAIIILGIEMIDF